MVNKNGQATVEFILLIPFFITIFLIVSQLGYIVYLQNNIKQLSREAARIISTTNSNDLGINLINQSKMAGEELSLNININPYQDTQRKVGDMLKVGISLNYSGFGDLIKKLFGKTLLIYSESCMRMECE
ncbi:pilus assembly protein [bacterium]|nr:pilus assembly protein [bacterium]